MTPRIALDLSLDGIAVLSRAPNGDWWREGTVRLDAEDLPERLAALRDLAEARAGRDFTSILILPDSQLLYTSLERDDRRPEETVRALLKGRTPYPVEDLAFDYEPRGDRLQVAVVARETLAEAESFAADYGFRPVAVVANPRGQSYPSIPTFGRTSIAGELLGKETLELDLGTGFHVVPAPAPPRLVGTPEPDPRAAPETAAPEPTEAEDPTPTFARPGADAPSSPPRPATAPPAPRPSDDVQPGFASSRRRSAPITLHPGPDGDRAAPRLERPTDVRPAQGASGPLPSPAGEAATRASRQPAAPAATGPATPSNTPEDGVWAPVAAAPPETSTRAQDERAPEAEPPPPSTQAAPRPGPEEPSTTVRRKSHSKAADPEAEALALPGFARERAASPRRSGVRLGLALTAGLLALLLLIGLASVLIGPDDGEPDASLILRPDEAVDEAGPRASVSAPAETGQTMPDGAIDVATLLPSAGEATPTDVSPIPDLVTPPLPLPGETPEELAEAGDPGPADDAALAAPPAETFSASGSFTAPSPPAAPDPQAIEDIYIASIDPDPTWGDAVALPPLDPPADGLSVQTVPAPAGTAFPIDAAGLTAATPEGTLAPGGYLVVAGRPGTMPAPRPDDAPAVAVQASADAAAQEVLRRIRPTSRPEDAAEIVERVVNNGFTRAELTQMRPTPRPGEIANVSAAIVAAQQAAAASLASSQASALAGTADTVPAPQSGPVSDLALALSGRPSTRPGSIERDAARIVAQRRDQVASAPAAATPQPAATQQVVRSAGGNVARAATDGNVLRLNQTNLIGVYGRAGARRALVRLSNGRYVKVEVGDRLDRGRVTAIGESELSYQRGGRNVVLRMPRA